MWTVRLFPHSPFYFILGVVKMIENPFGICFNMLKIKYATYDSSLSALGKIQPNDKINVFLNVETILNYLSMMQDLEKKLILNQSYKRTMVSDLINVAAHYKEFFKNNGLETKVFLYMTDLTSEEESFHESKYNMDYRCYYLNKFQGNPKFSLLTESLVNDIIPQVKTICDFTPDVYFLNGENLEGSLIPYIVSEAYPERFNCIVSGDLYETQYAFRPKFIHHLFKRKFGDVHLGCEVRDYLKAVAKVESVTPEEIDIYQNIGFYTLLLACRGDRYRSIDKIMGVGLKSLTKKIIEFMNRGKITSTTKNIDLLAELFEEGYQRDSVVSNFNAISLNNSIELLTEGEKKLVLSQIVDRSDLNSLMSLNQTLFAGCEIRIESLLS